MSFTWVFVLSVLLSIAASEDLWINPCGMIYRKHPLKPSLVERESKRLIPLVNELYQLSKSSYLDNEGNFQFNSELYLDEFFTYILTERIHFKKFMQYYSHLLARAYKTMQNFAFEFEIALWHVENDRFHEHNGISAAMRLVARKNSEAICELDIFMRKIEIEFEGVDQFTIPLEMLVRNKGNTDSKIRWTKLYHEYRTFLQHFKKILLTDPTGTDKFRHSKHNNF